MKFVLDSRKLHEEVDVTPFGIFHFSMKNPDPNKKWKAFFGRKTKKKFAVYEDQWELARKVTNPHPLP